MLFHALISSPLGPILLQADEARLQGLHFADQRDCPRVPGVAPARADALRPAEGVLNGRPLRTLKAQRPAATDLAGVAGQKTAHQSVTDLKAGTPGDSPQAVPSGRAGAAEAPAGVLQLLQDDTPEGSLAVLRQAQAQLADYLQGRRCVFDVPLAPHGTPFQKKVWDALLTIPCGETVSYGEVARRAGLGAGHGRAVGSAVGSNPISILIPCHRVLASNGTLNGYGGGLNRKVRLLEIEGFVLG